MSKETCNISQPTSEDQIATLLAQVESLSRDNERLARDNAHMAPEMTRIADTLEAELAAARVERDRLLEPVRLANQRFFGSKSEKVVPDQPSLSNDREAAADGAEEPALEEALAAKPRRRGGKRKIDCSKLEQVAFRHGLAEGERACPACGSELSETNVEVTYALRMAPAHLVAERHERVVYRCDARCAKNAEDGSAPSVIRRADMPTPPIKGSFATPSLISYIMNGKYANALPLYRMEHDLKCLGADVSRQNMADWVMRSHERRLPLIASRTKARLLAGGIVHADETEVQVLEEPHREAERKSRTWLFCAPARDRPLYAYEYHPTRSGEVAERFLEGWTGTLATDGYKPYFRIDGIANAACLVHARRRFAEIAKVAGGGVKAEEAGSVALEARRMIDRMFAVDSKFDALDAKERQVRRNVELRPLMEKFFV